MLLRLESKLVALWQIHDVAASAGIVLPEALRPCGLPLSATYTVNFSGALLT